MHYSLIKQFLDIDKHKDRSKFAYVFNLCKYKDDGVHWLSLYIDFDTNSIFYFDSVGFPPMEKIFRIEAPECKEDEKKINDMMGGNVNQIEKQAIISLMI